jgi:hypothetical protein
MNNFNVKTMFFVRSWQVNPTKIQVSLATVTPLGAGIT